VRDPGCSLAIGRVWKIKYLERVEDTAEFRMEQGEDKSEENTPEGILGPFQFIHCL
jgi:hypothetical protein